MSNRVKNSIVDIQHKVHDSKTFSRIITSRKLLKKNLTLALYYTDLFYFGVGGNLETIVLR